MTHRVSVCIPVFNGGRFIEATIHSILGQTMDNFELVVVDNRSTDDTVERVTAINDDRLRLEQPHDHVDAVANFARATAACSGPYVKLVCADDLLAPECLQRQADALDEHPSAVLVAARRRIVNGTGKTVIRSRGLGSMTGLVPGPEAIAHCVRSGTNLLGEPAAAMMRADALAASGSWRGDLPYMTDLDLWFRLLGCGDLVALPQTLATFRVHPGGWSAQIGRTQARQARCLFEREAGRSETHVTRNDLRLGKLKASLLQQARRGLYASRGAGPDRRLPRSAKNAGRDV